jgi:hypothetical protein
MARRACLATVLAVAATALLAGPAAAGTPRGFWGVDSVLEPSGAEFNLMRQTGVEVYRMPVSWRQIEPRKPTSTLAGREVRTYDWAEPDRLITRAAQTGIQPQLTFIDTPAWLAADGRTSPVRTPAGVRGWRAFTAAVVARYGHGGTFWAAHPELPADPPTGYQIWNEMNAPGRYQPKPDPEEYAQLFRLAGNEVRKGDPSAEIITGGMFGTPQTETSYTGWAFLRKLLAEPGVRPLMSGVGVHPYSPNLAGIKYQMDKMRATLDRAGMKRIPLLVTELGWSSGVHKEKFFFFKGPRGQTRMLKRSYRVFLKNRKRWNLKRVVWFAWRDAPKGEVPKGCTFCRQFGLLREDLSPKGSYRVYKRYATGKSKLTR